MHYASSGQNRKDFWIAFAAWLGINVVAIVIIQAVSSASGQDNSGSVFGALSVLLFLLNLAGVVVPFPLSGSSIDEFGEPGQTRELLLLGWSQLLEARKVTGLVKQCSES
jgi:hypothetical protein